MNESRLHDLWPILERGGVIAQTFPHNMRVRIFNCTHISGMTSHDGKYEDPADRDDLSPRYCVQIFSQGFGDLMADLPDEDAVIRFIGAFVIGYDVTTGYHIEGNI